MRPRTTLLLLLIASLIGVAIYNLERYVPSTRDKESREANPLPFDAAKVDGIEVEAAEASVAFNSQDHVWRVGKPLQDIADPERVQGLIDSLAKATWLDHLARREMSESAWKLTGLEKPFAHVKLVSAGRTVAECWVGNASAIEGACYITIPGTKPDQTDSYVVLTDLPLRLKKPMAEWRDSKLVRVPAESVSKLVISTGHGQIEVARKKPKAPWDLIKPLQTRGNNERINELLATVLALKISAVKQDDASKTILPADALHITVHSAAASQPVEVVLTQPLDSTALETQATTSHRTQAFTVSSDRLATLWAQLTELRDDRLARVDPEKVEAVIVKSIVTGEVSLRRQGDSWLLRRSTDWEPANGDRVAKMFEALNEHRVKEFVADSAANLELYGLAAPFLTVSWNEADEKPGSNSAASAQEGTDSELLFGQDTQGNVFAKYEQEPFIYRVGASVLQALPRDNVRWKALNPVRFSQFALLRIAISVGTSPPVILDHDPVSANWKGTRAGENLTPFIDRVKADHLVDKLGGLVVEDWVQDRTDGTKSLQTPAVTIQVTTLTDAGNIKSPTKFITINFAPTVPGTDSALYYGRVDNGPDIFMITRDHLRELLASVLKAK